MTVTTTDATGTTDRRAALAFFVVIGLGCLVLGGCGAKQTQLQSELVGTEWVIVEMTGFPDDNIVSGNFDFTNQRFRYFDGVNHKTSEIDWNETGFTVKGGGDSTLMAHDDFPGPYLDTLVTAGTRVEIAKRADGSLTLTRGGLTVAADPA